jgi:hypothetical protein
MNLDIDTLVKLAQLLQPSQTQQNEPKIISNLGKSFVGKYVIVRSRNEGINAGKVLELDETGVILEDARRLYYHKPANKNLSWYEGVAKEGISKDSKVGEPVLKLIIEDYSLTVCTDEAEQSIRKAKTNAQT